MNNPTPDRTRILRYCKRAVVVAVVVAVLFAAISVHLLGISARTIGSGSMEPNMHIGDLVFIRNVPNTGIVTNEDGATSGYKTFGDYGRSYTEGTGAPRRLQSSTAQCIMWRQASRCGKAVRLRHMLDISRKEIIIR